MEDQIVEALNGITHVLRILTSVMGVIGLAIVMGLVSLRRNGDGK